MLTKEQIEKTNTEYIYRYRSSSEYNFDALLKNEMFAATPNILNDPLDCCITYDLNTLYNRLVNLKSFNTYYCRNSKKDLNELEKINGAKKIIDNLAKKIIYDIRESFGVISFSLINNSNIMWSHYASNFKGFILSYNFQSMNKIVNTYLEHNWSAKHNKELYGFHLVKYISMDEMVDGTELMYELIRKRLMNKNRFVDSSEFIKESKHLDVFLSLLTTKNNSWEYEHEVRLILPRDHLVISEYKAFEINMPQVFKISECYVPNEIIIGSQMTNVNKAIVGYYCYKNENVILSQIDVSKLMSEKILYKNLVKPSELIEQNKYIIGNGSNK